MCARHSAGSAHRIKPVRDDAGRGTSNRVGDRHDLGGCRDTNEGVSAYLTGYGPFFGAASMAELETAISALEAGAIAAAVAAAVIGVTIGIISMVKRKV